MRKPQSAFEKFRGLKKIRQVSLVLAAVVVLGVSGLGAYKFGTSSAAKPGSAPTAAVNTLALSPSSGKLAPGATLSVTMLANSGSTPVNAVQSRVTYDPARLEFDGLQETGVFTNSAATDLSVPGVIRFARAVETPVSGSLSVIQMNFTVKSGIRGGTPITIDQTESFLVDAETSSNLLQSVSNANFTINGK